MEDTWREHASKLIVKIGAGEDEEEGPFEAVNPLRGEELRNARKHVTSSLGDITIVRRDLYDIDRCARSGGLMLANLNTTSTGRTPVGTLFELQAAYDRSMPVVCVTGNTAAHIKNHPWVKYCTAVEVTSVTRAIEAIEEIFL